jgi:hypothetical protein
MCLELLWTDPGLSTTEGHGKIREMAGQNTGQIILRIRVEIQPTRLQPCRNNFILLNNKNIMFKILL